MNFESLSLLPLFVTRLVALRTGTSSQTLNCFPILEKFRDFLLTWKDKRMVSKLIITFAFFNFLQFADCFELPQKLWWIEDIEKFLRVGKAMMNTKVLRYKHSKIC